MTKQVTDEWLSETRELIDREWSWSYERDRLELALDEIDRLRFACPFCGCEERFTNQSGSCRRCGAPEDLANARNHLLLPPWDAVATHLKKLRGAVKAESPR